MASQLSTNDLPGVNCQFDVLTPLNDKTLTTSKNLATSYSLQSKNHAPENNIPRTNRQPYEPATKSRRRRIGDRTNRQPNRPGIAPTARPNKPPGISPLSQRFALRQHFVPQQAATKKTAPEQTPPHRTARHITSRQAYRPSAAISPLGSHNKKQRPEGRRISLTPGAASRHKTYSLII